MNLQDLVSDLFCYLTVSNLSIFDLVRLSRCSKKLSHLSNNPTIWREFCLADFGMQSLDAFPQTNAIDKISKEDFLVSNKDKVSTLEKSWKNFFKLMYCSEVYSWGDSGGGRLGHGPNIDGKVSQPKLVKALQGKSVKYLGKTAEVGSCAFSFSGKKFFLWGSRERSAVPVTYDVSDYSSVPDDHVVHISCGHDSGFLVVLDSGKVLTKSYSMKHLYCISDYVVNPHLLEGEKPIWSIGSQSGMSGVVTNMSRVIAWRTEMGNTYADRQLKKKAAKLMKEKQEKEEREKREKEEREKREQKESRAEQPQTDGENLLPSTIKAQQVQEVEQTEGDEEEREPYSEWETMLKELNNMHFKDSGTDAEDESDYCTCFVVPPRDPNAGQDFTVNKAAFGHRKWFAIGPNQKLYWIDLSRFPGSWGTPIGDGVKLLVCTFWQSVPNTEGLRIVDVDSGTNHSGFVTSEGDVYTWGDPAHGCLGHGDHQDLSQPKRVEYFNNNKMKAVAIGCGGYVSWSGGFTIVLLDDNRLFYFGRLGTDTHQRTPIQVIVPDRMILSISAGEDWAGIVTCRKLTDGDEEEPEEEEEEKEELDQREEPTAVEGHYDW